MPKPQPSFTAEFKQEAVQLITWNAFIIGPVDIPPYST
jgi:hypothetical protein